MCKNNQKLAKQQGFTLVELIISMLIFAIISLIAYNALQTYSTNQRVAFEHFRKISVLQKTILFVKRDVNQVFNQDISLKNNVLTLLSLQNDKILNIRYLLKDSNLIREYATDVDNITGLMLLENVKKFKLRLLNDQGKWLSEYKTLSTVQIKALELSFENDYWGKVKQLVMIGE